MSKLVKQYLKSYKSRIFTPPRVIRDKSGNSVLTISPAKGGMILNWCVDNKEVFYLDRSTVKRFGKPVRGGIPILFPICGGLPKGTYQHHSKPYKLGHHGFARNWPWTVYNDLCVDQGKLTLSLSSNQQTLKEFPFKFQLLFTYHLRGHTLTIEQKVLNFSMESMPFSLGLHPYFYTPDKSQLKIDIPAQSYHSQNDGKEYLWDGTFDYNKDEIKAYFKDLDRPSFRVLDPSRGLSVECSFQEPYAGLFFWTTKGKEFYCVEPWSSGFNSMNTGDRISYVKPRSCLSTSIDICVSTL
ncbi:MAG: hypothetical protein WBA10_20080 [Elainellaceae cyanobacterium]